MTDFAQPSLTPLLITTFSRFGCGKLIRNYGGAITPASSAWQTVDTMLYLPLWLPFPYVVRRLFWVNGSSANGNWAIGLLNQEGVRIYGSAATAASGASQPQYVATSSPILLAPGRYYLALTHSSAAANHAWSGNNFNNPRMKMAGILQEASQSTVPATWTPVTASSSLIPLAGITRTASGF